MRTEKQCKRLAYEENLLRKYYPDAETHNRLGNPSHTVPITKPEFSQNYMLGLGLPGNYPDGKASLRVEFPKTLWRYKNRAPINSLGISHAYHVYGQDENGCVKICFADDWNASYTTVLAIWRGQIWLAAYEVHLVTGRTIATIIDGWKKKLKRRSEVAQSGVKIYWP